MKWLSLENPEAVASPGLLVDPDRAAANVDRMVTIVGGKAHVDRLRPHVKTHKMSAVIQLQMQAGIDKFKAATLSEVAMVAGVGAADVLLAYQPVGPNLARLAQLVKQFPNTSFAVITDDPDAAREVAKTVGNPQRPFRLFIDVDCGMHRTGIKLGPSLDRLRDTIESLAGVCFAGLHVYDGHIHDRSLDQRKKTAMHVIETVRRYNLEHPLPTVIGGGSPTFAIWAAETEWECSPGTTVFWDAGYGGNHADLPFEVAIALLTRVISKPGDNRLCLDLGYKSVAAEMPLERRVTIPDLPDAEFVGQSEEHLIVTTDRASQIAIGDSMLAYPQHICPTVALYAFASLIRNGRATGETWPVTARDR